MDSNDFNKYGVPSQKKFPMPDADHVRSAIKFFNYVDPQYEKILARAILQRAKEYGVDLSEMSIGDENRFKKYLPENELKHHGIKGQKWGIRRFQNEDGTLTAEGKKRYGYLLEASSKANRFAGYAREEEAKYSKKSGIKYNKEDTERWSKAAKVQRQHYEHMAKKYSEMRLEDLDKKTIKEAKDFLKNGFYTNVEYADYYANGKWNNYLLKDKK